MARPKGSKNKDGAAVQPASLLTPEERIVFLATVIAEHIAEDQANGQALLKQLGVTL